jgi:hypothetical protein
LSDSRRHAKGLAVSNGYVYAVDSDAGLQIIDVEPRLAYIVKQLIHPECRGVAIEHAYLADGFATSDNRC